MNVIEVGTATYKVPPKGYSSGERMIFLLAQSLLRQGHKSLVVDFEEGFASKEEEIKGVPIYRIGFPLHIKPGFNRLVFFLDSLLFAFFMIFHYRRFTKKLSPQVLHFHNSLQLIVFWLLRQLRVISNVKLVYSCHSPRWMNPEQFSWWEKLFAQVSDLPAVRLADLATFESPIIRQKVISLTRVPEEKIMVLYNGVDSKDDCNPAKYDVEPDFHTILYGAKFCGQKNQLVVVDAIPRVVDKCPKARFLFVGGIEDKGYYKRVKEKVKQLGVEEFIEFRGQKTIDEFRMLQANSGIHLVFSKYTGFDIAIGESLSFGRAVIASDIPTLKGLVTHKKDCLVVEPQDNAGLAQAILELIENEDLRKEISANARQLAQQKLEWTVLIDSFIEKIALI